MQTGDPVRTASGREVAATREGGGLINLRARDDPLVFAAPTGLSFGVLDGRATRRAASR